MDRHAVGPPAGATACRRRSSRSKGSPWQMHANGHLTAWSGAWGVSFAANLTPDQNTGLGIWTEEMFVNAMKTGKHMGDVAPDPAADAVELVRPAAGRGPEGDVRVSEVDQADRQPRAACPLDGP